MSKTKTLSKPDWLKIKINLNENYKYAEDYDVTARLVLARMNATICQSFHLNVRRHNQQQSQQYLSIQIEMSRKVQFNTLSYFLKDDNDIAQLLLSFYRREIPLSYF